MASFARAGSRAFEATSRNDGTVRLWDPDVRDRAAEVCKLTRALAGPRWQQLMTDLPVDRCRKGG
ncbi:hypothetical protein [Streptomyces sp. NRRL B-24085]|uniref:hypothetical protein n=1 Tax=Streptomyces sp. NRRL B-24085 TaxID=1709476 RepID=UPI0006B33A46|nr:hypothetical protein [Streptomyces sp. NRRL B-24085]